MVATGVEDVIHLALGLGAVGESVDVHGVINFANSECLAITMNDLGFQPNWLGLGLLDDDGTGSIHRRGLLRENWRSEK